MSRLNEIDQLRSMKVAHEFLGRIMNHVDMTYLHLDVDQHKEQTRTVPAYRWRALLITNRGRYHADGWSFGASEALSVVLDKLYEQLDSRLGRLQEVPMVS